MQHHRPRAANAKQAHVARVNRRMVRQKIERHQQVFDALSNERPAQVHRQHRRAKGVVEISSARFDVGRLAVAAQVDSQHDAIFLQLAFDRAAGLKARRLASRVGIHHRGAAARRAFRHTQ